MIILNLELFIQQTKKWLHTSIIIMEKPTEDDLWVLEFANEVNLYFISNRQKQEFGDNIWTTAKNHWIRSFFLIDIIANSNFMVYSDF